MMRVELFRRIPVIAYMVLLASFIVLCMPARALAYSSYGASDRVEITATLDEHGVLNVRDSRVCPKSDDESLWWDYESPATLSGIKIDSVTVGEHAEKGEKLSEVEYQEKWEHGEFPETRCYSFDTSRNRFYVFGEWDYSPIHVTVEYHVDKIVDICGDAGYLIWNVSGVHNPYDDNRQHISLTVPDFADSVGESEMVSAVYELENRSSGANYLSVEDGPDAPSYAYDPSSGESGSDDFWAGFALVYTIIGVFLIVLLGKRVTDKREQIRRSRKPAPVEAWKDLPDDTAHPLVIASIDGGELQNPFAAAVMHLIAIGAVSAEWGLVWCPKEQSTETPVWLSEALVLAGKCGSADELQRIKRDERYHEVEDLLLTRLVECSDLENWLDTLIFDVLFERGDSLNSHVWMGELNHAFGLEESKVTRDLGEWARVYQRQCEKAGYWEPTPEATGEFETLKRIGLPYAVVGCVGAALISMLGFAGTISSVLPFSLLLVYYWALKVTRPIPDAKRLTEYGDTVKARMGALEAWICEKPDEVAALSGENKVVDFAVCLELRDAPMKALGDIAVQAPAGSKLAQAYVWWWEYNGSE